MQRFSSGPLGRLVRESSGVVRWLRAVGVVHPHRRRVAPVGRRLRIVSLELRSCSVLAQRRRLKRDLLFARVRLPTESVPRQQQCQADQADQGGPTWPFSEARPSFSQGGSENARASCALACAPSHRRGGRPVALPLSLLLSGAVRPPRASSVRRRAKQLAMGSQVSGVKS